MFRQRFVFVFIPSTDDADGWNRAVMKKNAQYSTFGKKYGLCIEMFHDNAINQQVDSKNFQRYVPIQIVHMFMCACICFLRFEDVQTCKLLTRRSNDDSQKSGKKVTKNRDEAKRGEYSHIMCFLCSCLAAARVCLKTKIRLKCLHSGKHPFFTAEYHRVTALTLWRADSAKHQTSVTRCVFMFVCEYECECIFYEQDLHAHIIYYHESRVNHRVISKPDCLCLLLFLSHSSIHYVCLFAAHFLHPKFVFTQKDDFMRMKWSDAKFKKDVHFCEKFSQEFFCTFYSLPLITKRG